MEKILSIKIVDLLKEKRKYLNFLVSVILPAIFYFHNTWSLRALNLGQVSWMNYPDMKQAYLSWGYFCNSQWNFPLGLNPNFGMGISNSIVFADNVPILAILFKIIFHENCNLQYFGIYLLVSSLLFNFFCVKILSLFTRNILFITSSVLILSFLSINVFYTQYYLALSGTMWILVAGIYLLKLNSEHHSKFGSWINLFCVATFINFYITALLAVLFIYGLVAGSIRLKAKKSTFYFFASLLLSQFLIMVILGYFTIPFSGSQGSGYGYYRIDMFALFNPSKFSGFPSLFNDVDKGLNEGISYLGVSLLFMLFFLLIEFISNFKFEQFKKFSNISRTVCGMVFLFLVALFAASNNLVLAGNSISVPLPSFIIDVASIFRSSQRFFWPITLLLSFWILRRFFFSVTVQDLLSRNSYFLYFLFFVLAFAQINESESFRRVLSDVRHKDASYSRISNINLDYWLERSASIDSFRVLMPQNAPNGWLNCASTAFYLNLPTECYYTSRIDSFKVEKIRSERILQISSRNLDGNSVYLLSNLASDLEKLENSKYLQAGELISIDGNVYFHPLLNAVR